MRGVVREIFFSKNRIQEVRLALSILDIWSFVEVTDLLQAISFDDVTKGLLDIRNIHFQNYFEKLKHG